MCKCFNILAMCGHGRCKRLGSCLVLQPGASCVVSLQHVPMFHSAGCERLNILIVHGHGRGTHLGRCLVYAAFIVAFVACFNGYEFSVLYLILLHQLCMGMDDASALVRALCLSYVHPVS